MNGFDENSSIKTWKRPNEPFNLSSNRSKKCYIRSIGENSKCKVVGLLDQKGTLSTLQGGGRAKRTTIDHVLFLEATLRKAQANSEQFVSVFFDMETAYD